jgi:hypothetical protein
VKQINNPNSSLENKLLLLNKAYTYAEQTPNDSLKTSYFSYLSFNLPSSLDSSLYRKINKKAIYLNNKAENSLALGNAYWDLALFFEKNTIKDSAYYSYSEAQKIFDQDDNKSFSGRMLLSMANIQMQIKDY